MEVSNLNFDVRRITTTVFSTIVLWGNMEAHGKTCSQAPVTLDDTTRTYNLGEIVVNANRQMEERVIGPYKQPEWTLVRRFASTRVYVQALPGTVEFEQWFEVRVPRESGKSTVTRVRQELAFGLGQHLQLDVYLNSEHSLDATTSLFALRGWSAEIRWALADWGVIPGNPTVYFEYLFSNEDPGKIEPKLLLGGELRPKWHWGVNLVYERELAGSSDRDEEFAGTGAVSYTIVDEKLSVGGAASVATAIERSSGSSDHSTEFFLGPSLQWRPVSKGFLNLEPLIGMTDDSKKLKMFLVFGWSL